MAIQADMIDDVLEQLEETLKTLNDKQITNNSKTNKG